METNCQPLEDVAPSYFFKNIVILIISLTFLVHAWHLNSVPKGFNVDEAYFARISMSIAKTGRDPTGKKMPLIFIMPELPEAKGPFYIYTAALFFFLNGSGHVALFRLTSVIFFMIFYLSCLTLIRQITRAHNQTMIVMALAAGFLPWLFPLSRIGFDVIAQPAIYMLFLLFLYLAYHFPSRWQTVSAALSGGLLGLSASTYASAYLLTPFAFGLFLVFYCRRNIIKSSVNFIGAFTMSIAPYLYYWLRHPGGMTHRFNSTTYLLDSAPWNEKLTHFIGNYLQNFSLDFLLFHGDSELRHASGYGGQLSYFVFILAVCGIAWFCLHGRKEQDSKFFNFLLINILFAPVPSAMTKLGNTPHALRTVLLGIFVLIFAGYGYYHLIGRRLRGWPKRALFLTSILFITTESALYVHDYFTRFPDASVPNFGAVGLQDAFLTAIDRSPQAINVSHEFHRYYYEFFSSALPNPKKIPFAHGEVKLASNTCLITYQQTAIPPIEGLITNHIDIEPSNRVYCSLPIR